MTDRLSRLYNLERANVLMRVFGHRNALAMMDAIEEITLPGHDNKGDARNV